MIYVLTYFFLMVTIIAVTVSLIRLRRRAALLNEQLRQERENLQKVKRRHRIEVIKTAMDHQELERTRIASDIHDSINSVLWLAKSNIDLWFKEQSDNTTTKGIVDARELLEEAMESSRTIAQNTTPNNIGKFGLVEAVKELCNRIKNKELNVVFNANGVVGKLTCDRSLQIYRLIQEIVNNLIKHAKATCISVELYGGSYLTVCFVDNGKPFQYHNNEASSGLGLLNINNRLDLLAASLRSEAGPPNKLEVLIPMTDLSLTEVNLNQYPKNRVLLSGDGKTNLAR